MSAAELKTLKSIVAIAVAGVGYLWGACEHSRAEKLNRELEEEISKNSPWADRVQNKDDIQIGE